MQRNEEAELHFLVTLGLLVGFIILAAVSYYA
jgi:hypothetical protein